ncbi:MAG: hypothetical protein JWQ98_2542 [Chlorobi bacterium]|nr:hypothetical protein [Chlorobiota bacterium]
MNGDTTDIRIVSFPPGATVEVGGDSATYHSREIIHIPRSDRDLVITVANDSLKRKIVVEPYFDGAYLFGNMLSDGIGYLFDIGTDRKYRYDDNIHVDLTDTTRGYPTVRSGMPKRGDARFGAVLSILIPPLLQFTYFSIDTGRSAISSEGILSAMGSVDYFHGNHSFLSFTAGAATDRFGEHFDSSFSTTDIWFASVAYGHDGQHGWLSYGIQMTRTHFGYVGNPSVEEIAAERNDIVIGARLSGSLRLSDYFHLVFNYTPNLYSAHYGFGWQPTQFLSMGVWVMSAGKAPF